MKDLTGQAAGPGPIALAIAVGSLFLLASPSAVPAQQDAAVTYQDHVLPILTTHCLGCHNADKKKGDLDLSSYSAALAGGGSGELAAAGDSGGSVLYKVVAHLADPKMPPKKPKISDAEIAILKDRKSTRLNSSHSSISYA